MIVRRVKLRNGEIRIVLLIGLVKYTFRSIAELKARQWKVMRYRNRDCSYIMFCFLQDRSGVSIRTELAGGAQLDDNGVQAVIKVPTGRDPVSVLQATLAARHALYSERACGTA